MRWDYKIKRHDALVRIISNNFEKSKSIDVPDLARDIEKYIKATHTKRSQKSSNTQRKTQVGIRKG